MNPRVVVDEVAAAIVVLFAVTSCASASCKRGEGAAGAAVRILATLTLPSLVFAFAHAFWWPLGLVGSAAAAAVQFKPSAVEDLVASTKRAFAVTWPTWLAFGLLLVAVAMRAALSLASQPYDNDAMLYHLPTSIEYLQTHTAVPAQVTFDPGVSELLDSLGLGAQHAVGGQTLTEGVVVLVLFLSAFGFARRIGAPPELALACAIGVSAIPFVGDQVFTADNDVLVCALLLAAVALSGRSSRLCAVAIGLLAGAKFTGLATGVAVFAVLWPARALRLPWKDVGIAILIAAPWYVRNLFEVHNPIFLGSQTSGFGSTIAAHLVASAPYVLRALRSYGSLLALIGIVALFSRPIRMAGNEVLRVIPVLVTITLAIWLFVPNSAQTIPGTLNHIATGWSVRYALFSVALLNIAALYWLWSLRTWVATTGAMWAALSTAIRTFGASMSLDREALLFVFPLFVVLALAAASLMVKMRTLRYALAILACVGYGLLATNGSQRIAEHWNARYSAFDAGRPLRILDAPFIMRSHAIATIALRPLPFMGPHFERYVVADVAGLPPRAWLEEVTSSHVELVVVGRTVDGTGDRRQENAPTDEELVRGSTTFQQVYRDDVVTVYERRIRSTGALTRARKPPGNSSRCSVRRRAEAHCFERWYSCARDSASQS